MMVCESGCAMGRLSREKIRSIREINRLISLHPNEHVKSLPH